MRLSLKLYLDDCAYSHQLTLLLRKAGHQVITPADAGTTHKDDLVHFQYAGANGCVLVTKNPKHFEKLHSADSNHPGIVAIYQDNDPSRDMEYAEIVRAVGNIEQSGVAFAGWFHVLNHW